VLRKWMLPDEQQYVAAIWSSAVPGEPFEFQHRLRRSDGRRLVVLHRGMVEVGADGTSARGIAILQDITAQREAEKRIQELAHFDEVTGLPNRSLLLDHMDAAVHTAHREARHVALISINVDEVQKVKESIGLTAGDALTRAIASRLKHACSEDDTPAHLGGGEFAILVDPRSVCDEQAALSVVRAVQSALAGTELVDQTEVFLSPHIGVALFPNDGDSAQRLLEASQTAMRSAAEQEGEAGVCFFKPEASARAMRRLALESALRHAIERNELYLHYQPQIDLGTGELAGVEALLRWRHDSLGSVSPVEFIPIAEQTGLIVPIGEWVLRTACEQIVQWQKAGLPPLRVGVNLSTCQLQQPDLSQRVHGILHETGADPGSLGVEVTESMLAEDVQHAALTLTQIRSLGVKISLDDFGTGYSNLRYLNTLPIDVIKIDRSFVNDLTSGNADASVTRAIIMMARSLHMMVLAEGVENHEQLSLLMADGCDQMQGYFFSKPVPPQDIQTMLRDNRNLTREVQAIQQTLAVSSASTDLFAAGTTTLDSLANPRAPASMHNA
jgi:diguanylate cyclase (GGDEF)-like protein